MSKSLNYRKIKVSLFSSFEEENAAEHTRLATMTPTQRLNEFGTLQERVWGKKWTNNRIVKTASIERLAWQ